MKWKNKNKIKGELIPFKRSTIKTLFFMVVVVILTLAISLTIFVYTPLVRSLGIVGQNRLISSERAFENIIAIDDDMSVNELIFRYFIGKQQGEVMDYNKIIKTIAQVDSLNNEVELWKVYAYNINQIIDGTKAPLRADSVIEKGRALGDVVATRSALDTLLRNQVVAQIEKLENDNAANNKYKIYPPISGQITTQFSLKQKTYGIIISTNKVAPVMSVGEGTITSSVWTPNYGYVIQIQHPDNMLSVYKGVTNTLKDVGARVSAREVIGYIGGNEAAEIDTLMNVLNPQSHNNLYFELWENGNRIDPEKYIIF